VIDLAFGILVYPPETEGEPWRATFTSDTGNQAACVGERLHPVGYSRCCFVLAVAAADRQPASNDRSGCAGSSSVRWVYMGYTDAPAGWWREFISALPARTAKLAVVRAGGSPHVAPVWVELDGDQIVFTTPADTVKGKAILRDPTESLCWDDERPPFSFVTILGGGSNICRPC
jgi:hypothetical protein